MAEVLVRDLSEDVLNRLKALAKAHGRSLEAELRFILEQAARVTLDMVAARALADEMRTQLAGRSHSDSSEFAG
jgi:plasmid stability protein